MRVTSSLNKPSVSESDWRSCAEVCSLSLCRFAIKLLEDLVFFVVDQVNSGQPVLDVVNSKPNRERQKLMREQNILKQVFHFEI